MFLSIFLLFSCITAFAEEGFIFRDGITWGMTSEEIREKESNLKYVENTNIKGVGKLILDGAKVGKYEDARLIYRFLNNALYSTAYCIDADESQAKYIFTYLEATLSKKYGDSHSTTDQDLDSYVDYYKEMEGNINVNDDSSEFIDEMIQLYTTAWALPDGTTIFLGIDNENNSVNVIYVAPYGILLDTEGL